MRAVFSMPALLAAMLFGCGGTGGSVADAGRPPNTLDQDAPPNDAGPYGEGIVDARATAIVSCVEGGSGTSRCGGSDGCCTSLGVVGGKYYRTYKNDGGGPSDEADLATVSGFQLDRYLVTVARFRGFVAAWKSGWLPPEGSGKHSHLNGGHGLLAVGSSGTTEIGWTASAWNALVAPTDASLGCDPNYATWTASSAGNEHLPINCVNWYESYAFCIWDGGFLPSEAEWEYAAAGGGQQREYPWGATAPGSASNYAIYGCHYGQGGQCAGKVTDIATVGAAPLGVSRWGQLDMAGELFEWILDVYASPYPNPCVDCASLLDNASRVVRGGAFVYDSSYLMPSNRGTNAATLRTFLGGFRCARGP
jgi:formylglycine-generating enzyme required for sulfatase activity